MGGTALVSKTVTSDLAGIEITARVFSPSTRTDVSHSSVQLCSQPLDLGTRSNRREIRD